MHELILATCDEKQDTYVRSIAAEALVHSRTDLGLMDGEPTSSTCELMRRVVFNPQRLVCGSTADASLDAKQFLYSEAHHEYLATAAAFS